MIDKNYCMSSYLTFRFVFDQSKHFYNGLRHIKYAPKLKADLYPCKTAYEIGEKIKEYVAKEYVPGKTGIFLSGGIDSAIIASYLPKGTVAYTFKCIADGAINETKQASLYANYNNLDHRIIEMNWKDFEELTPKILKYTQVPVHSIEIQVYKALMQAKQDGIEKIFTGESADAIFGGMDKILGKDWTFEEWITRYTFVNPEDVLKEPVSMKSIYKKYRLPDNKVDVIRFMDEVYRFESSSSYAHAYKMADMHAFIEPYANLCMADPLDLERVRNGDPKYLIRELFSHRYPNITIPSKIPMPRAMNQWLKNWDGPKRKEFVSADKIPNFDKFTGDQKWLIYCLEMYLNIFDV